MRNWLGQKIEVGSVVGRGARDGDSSTFKIGRVVKLNDDKLKVTVDWKYRSTGARVPLGTTPPNYGSYYNMKEVAFLPYRSSSSKAPCSVETLFLLSEDDLERAERLAGVQQEFSERNVRDATNPMDEAEILAKIESLA